MSEQQKLTSAVTDTCTFINIMQQGDNLGVVAFSDNANQIYPASGMVAITGQPTLDAACAAVQGLTPLNMTNITAAVQMAQSMLANAPNPRAIVLLSDGMWNVGGNPMTGLATTIPIHTIALGNSFNPSFLQSMAQATGGTYHYTPDAFQLAEIYADISSDVGLAQLVVNSDYQTPQYRFSTTSATIVAGTGSGYYAISWQDPSIQFTTGTPTGRQLTARLVAPNGQASGLVPNATGAGFVVFKLPQPTAGNWQVEVWNAVPGGVRTTVGVYEPNSPLRLSLALQAPSPSTGGTIGYTATAADESGPIEDVRYSAWIERPLRSLEQTMDLLGPELAAIELPEGANADADEATDKLMRLAALQDLDPARGELHPRIMMPLEPPVWQDGRHVGTFGDAPVPGEYTLRVRATGISSATNGAFQRQRRLSVVVE
jgi:hypothetical protein